MNKDQKLYDILGIEPDASDKDIKKAYRKLAMIYHPDKNKDADAEDTFKKISFANEVLSNPEKRRIYDQLGEEGLKVMADNMTNPMDEIINNMNRRQRVIMHRITLAEYFTKDSVSIKVHKQSINCEECDATGFKDKIKHSCKSCAGTGNLVRTIRHGPIIQQITEICPKCKGKKYDTQIPMELSCEKCHGRGIIKQFDKVEVRLPFDQYGSNKTIIPEAIRTANGKHIDLVVKFDIKMPKNYFVERDGKLSHIMYINYTETICGFRRIINHPNGQKILIVAEPGYIINPDNIYKIDKMGFKHDDFMYIRFYINYPESITLSHPLSKHRKNKILNFEILESILGERLVPNIETDDDIDPENIFVLSTLNKININPYSNKQKNIDDEKDTADDETGYDNHADDGDIDDNDVDDNINPIQQCVQQ